MHLGGITQRVCLCLDGVCFAYEDFFVKDSGGEGRRVVVGLVMLAFWRWVGGGQTVLVLSHFFAVFSPYIY